MSVEVADIADRYESQLIDVVRAAQRAFAAAEVRPTVSEEPAQRVFDTLLGGDGQAVPAGGIDEPLPACVHLDEALAAAREHGGPIADLAEAVHTIAGQVTWIRREWPERPEFAREHANAVLVGSSGPDRDALIGVSLMAPNVRYPDHEHPPEEVYVVLSPGEWRNERDAWFEPGSGNVVHNPPGIVHAMRSGDAPLLAIWLHLDAHTSGTTVDG